MLVYQRVDHLLNARYGSAGTSKRRTWLIQLQFGDLAPGGSSGKLIGPVGGLKI